VRRNGEPLECGSLVDWFNFFLASFLAGRCSKKGPLKKIFVSKNCLCVLLPGIHISNATIKHSLFDLQVKILKSEGMNAWVFVFFAM
jgi:hypothetical protein